MGVGGPPFVCVRTLRIELSAWRSWDDSRRRWNVFARISFQGWFFTSIHFSVIISVVTLSIHTINFLSSMSTSHFRFEICERMTGDDQTIRNAYSCCSCASYHRSKLWKLSHLGKSIIVFVRKLNFVRWNNVHIFHWQKTSKFPSSKVDTLSSRLQFVDGKHTEEWKSVSNLALVDFFRRKSRSNDLKLLPILLWKWEEKRSDNVFPLPASSFAIQLRTFRKVSLIHHEKQIKVNRKVAPTTQTHEWEDAVVRGKRFWFLKL